MKRRDMADGQMRRCAEEGDGDLCGSGASRFCAPRSDQILEGIVTTVEDQTFVPGPHLPMIATSADKKGMPMRPSVVLDMKRIAVREAVGRFRTANPRVFGSVLHGTDRDGSDLDLLVDALPGATLLDLGDLQEELNALLGVNVDVLTPGDLPLKFRAQVLAEAQPV